MTIVEAAQQTLKEGAQLIRERKKEPRRYDVKPIFTGNHRGWVMLDSFTAGAICAVANAISDENKAKYQELYLPTLFKITWSLVGNKGAS